MKIVERGWYKSIGRFDQANREITLFTPDRSIDRRQKIPGSPESLRKMMHQPGYVKKNTREDKGKC